MAVADPVNARTYPGPAYSPQVATAARRARGHQSKVWFHAGAWWALMLEPTGRAVRVSELLPDHTWRPTSAVVNPDAIDAGDALVDGDDVHVVDPPGRRDACTTCACGSTPPPATTRPAPRRS